MKELSISLGKITSCVLFILWAMGDPNIQIWHWVVPYAYEVICGLIPHIAQWWVNRWSTTAGRPRKS